MVVTNLRRAILESNLDATTVAHRVGISSTLLSSFVCGHRPIRPTYHLLNLARVLDRQPSELLGYTTISAPPEPKGAPHVGADSR